VNTPARLTGFAAVLGLAFGGAALAGGAIDPDRSGEEQSAHAEKAEGHGGAEKAGGHGAVKQQAVRGLAVAENGARLVVDEPELRRGRTERLTYRVVDSRGATIEDFEVEHEKRMHLIVARRDLATFRHLHPAQNADGSWSIDIKLDEAGSYRLFADFKRDGKAMTLASDLRVDGAADLQPLPAPVAKAKSDGGYDVALERHGNELEFAISRDGKTVKTEPYLGAGGHLVALREGDLAFLHVHPSEHEESDAVAFETEFPTPGRYRLFLQFKREGRVHTVAFTQEVK
jgi:hypothetical protein